MALSEPFLSGPGAGRTVTHGHGTSTELKLAGEQSGGDWAVVEWRVRAGDEPGGDAKWRTIRRRLLLRLKFTGAYSHRTLEGGIGHNLPREAPDAYADAEVGGSRGT
jgi:hypothetical protein